MSQLSEVKVHQNRPRERPMSYVNPAYVHSVNNVSGGNPDARQPPPAPITEVYREQYWACSRWPHTTRVLAITVGVLTGALIGFIIFIVLKDDDNSPISGIFKSYAPD